MCRLNKNKEGRISLTLTENVSWETFSDLACGFLDQVNGKIIERKDSMLTCIWNIDIDGITLRLVFEDFPCQLDVDSLNKNGDRILLQIYEKLKSGEIKIY